MFWSERREPKNRRKPALILGLHAARSKLFPRLFPRIAMHTPPDHLQTQGGTVCERGANHQPEHHTTPLEDVAQQSESAAE